MAKLKKSGSTSRKVAASTDRSTRKPPAKAQPCSATELLEEMLPLAEPTELELHFNAAVLELGDPAQLLELAADSVLGPFLLCRLAPTIALVDPGRAEELADLLRRRGHTPKILKS
jgi:hypothetical protein